MEEENNNLNEEQEVQVTPEEKCCDSDSKCCNSGGCKCDEGECNGKCGSKCILSTVLIVVVIAALVGGGVYYWMNSKTSDVTPVTTKIDTTASVVKDDVTKTDTKDVKADTSATTYSNKYFGFSIDVPKDIKYCLNDFCQNDGEDKDVQYFKIAEDLSEGDNGYIEHLQIRPIKNLLEMSAVAFGKKLFGWNKKYDKNAIYSKEKESTFAGQKSYEFIATRGFEERGLVFTSDGAELELSKIEESGSGMLLDNPHKVIYFDHNGTMYRVMYPISSDVANKIIKSFKFTK